MKFKVEMIIDIEDFDALKSMAWDMISFIEGEYDCDIEVLTSAPIEEDTE